MQLLRTFSTPIWIDDLDLDLENIISTIKDIQSKSSGKVISNVGGWQSEDLHFDDIKNKHLQDLTKIIQNSIDDISRGIDSSMCLEIDNLWMNVNKCGDYNAPHYHTLSALSGVLYIQSDDASNIQFIQDTLRHHYPFWTNSELFADKFELFPKDGRLIIFPSWIKHSVLPNESNKERISISFNTRQIRNKK